MKKRIIILFIIMVLISGCSNIRNTSLESIISSLEKQTNKTNTFHTGYKYYLPVGLNIKDTKSFNDVLESEKYTFYLYADIISYFNGTELTKEKNEKAYFYQTFNYNSHSGYIQIILKRNDKYLIEIMFNYAKIEVMVDYEDINLAVNYAVTILRSIQYNDNVIANLLGDDILNYQEEIYDIFNTDNLNNDYLDRVEEYEEEEIRDEDLIN